MLPVNKFKKDALKLGRQRGITWLPTALIVLTIEMR